MLGRISSRRAMENATLSASGVDRLCAPCFVHSGAKGEERVGTKQHEVPSSRTLVVRPVRRLVRVDKEGKLTILQVITDECVLLGLSSRIDVLHHAVKLA